MTTMPRPTHPTGHASPRSRTAMAAFLAACRLEDGARWALIGAAVATAILILLAV
jgi:hypothetical protein